VSFPPVIAIRPEPGLGSTVEAGKAVGLDIQGFPLFETKPVSWDLPDATGFDALLVGSANVFHHGGSGLDQLRSLPVLAVGDTTGQAAREAGFAVKASGRGGLQSIIDAHGKEPAHWLRLAGKEHLPLEIPPHLKLTTRITYRVEAAEFPDELCQALLKKCAVLLHSAAAARLFAQQCTKHHIERSNIALAALGPRIADAAGEGWLELRSAQTPTQDALMALAKSLCETI